MRFCSRLVAGRPCSNLPKRIKSVTWRHLTLTAQRLYEGRCRMYGAADAQNLGVSLSISAHSPIAGNCIAYQLHDEQDQQDEEENGAAKYYRICGHFYKEVRGA